MTPNRTLAELQAEARARITHRASELMVLFEDASVDSCIWAATVEERLFNGTPSVDPPIGIMGRQ